MEFVFMLENSFVEVACHPNVKSEAAAGDDVCAVIALVHACRPEWADYRAAIAQKQMQVLRLGRCGDLAQDDRL
jgi:hypothetical protein